MMNKNICVNRWLFFFVLFFGVSTVFSQDTLSPAPKVPVRLSFVSESDVAHFIIAQEESIDSSLSSFHRMRGFLYDITQGKNIFFPGNKLRYRNNAAEFSDDILMPYKFSDRTIRYYNLNKRFTEITYLIGGKKEQLLNIIYAQNLLKGWSAGIDFRRAGAEGFFQRQQFYQSSFDVFTRYKSTNERYHLFAYYLRNRLEQEENGGIINFNPDENTVAQPAFLSSAENTQTDKEFLLRQLFQLRKQVADSSLPARNVITAGHTVRYRIQGNAYMDNPADSFYESNLLDTVSTSDSTWYQRWNNEFVLRYGGTVPGAWSVSLSAGHEYFIYKYGRTGSFIFGEKENIYGCAAINWNKNRNYLDGKVSVYFDDYDGDYDARLLYSRIFFKDLWKLFVSAHSSVKHPDITDIRRYTNHFIWFNRFEPETLQKTEAGISTTDKKFLFSGSYARNEDMIYYDSIPKQLGEAISIIKFRLQKNFTWKSWDFENIIEYRKTDNENIIHIPEFMTGHSLAYEKYFFRSALLGRVGVDVRYVSAYYADRYMPALQEFYLQSTRKAAGYVQADFFITFKVKSARFFAKMENVLSGIYNEPKFSRPDYPLTPRYVRFGLQMRFYD